MRACLCRLCVHCFCYKAGFGMDASHDLPRGVLFSITLIGDLLGVGISSLCRL